MPLSDPKCNFGVHSVTAYNPDSLVPFGTAKVVGSISFNSAGEIIDLFGGSNPYPFKKEVGTIDASGSFLFKEYPDWAFEAFLGKAATVSSAETAGSVTTLTNRRNATVQDATTGIASIGLKSGSSADVKTARYVVVAASATTVDVFAMSDVDFATGSDLTFQNDALKITASALTVSTGAAVEIPNTGLELTGGSGTIAFVTGDTASSESKAINDGSTDVILGSNTTTFVDVGLIFLGQKQKGGEIIELDIYRGLGAGMPFNFTEKAFTDVEIPFGAQFDSTRNGVFSYRQVRNS